MTVYRGGGGGGGGGTNSCFILPSIIYPITGIKLTRGPVA